MAQEENSGRSPGPWPRRGPEDPVTVLAHRGGIGALAREHPRGLRRRPARRGRRRGARRPPDAPTGRWSSTTTPRSRDRGHPRAPARRAPGLGPHPRARPRRLCRGRRQRGDQEHPHRPRLRPGRARWPPTSPRSWSGAAGAADRGPATSSCPRSGPPPLGRRAAVGRRWPLGLLVHPSLDPCAALDRPRRSAARRSIPSTPRSRRRSWAGPTPGPGRRHLDREQPRRPRRRRRRRGGRRDHRPGGRHPRPPGTALTDPAGRRSGHRAPVGRIGRGRRPRGQSRP